MDKSQEVLLLSRAQLDNRGTNCCSPPPFVSPGTNWVPLQRQWMAPHLLNSSTRGQSISVSVVGGTVQRVQ